MRKPLIALLVLVLLAPAAAQSVTRNKSESYSDPALTIDLDAPAGTIYQPGDEVAFRMRTDQDGYVVVFDIDTEGFIHLLYPRDGKLFQKISSRQTYSVPENPGETLFVTGSTGMEFVFAMFVPNRSYIKEEQLGFLADNDKLPDEKKFRIDGDPFLAANLVARTMVRAPHTEEISLAYTYFFVNKGVDYPRYICPSCEAKGKDPYAEDLGFSLVVDLDHRAGLTYPLDEAFGTAGVGLADQSEVPEANDYAAEQTDDDNPTQVTRIYVSHYPDWSWGWYYRPWYATHYSPYWYYDTWCDPWYFGWGFTYYPYYSGWSVGFGWGYGWPSYYYPYYFSGHHPYRGYHHGHVAYRGFRHNERYRHGSALYTAMNHRTGRDRIQTRSVRYKQSAQVAKRTTRDYATRGYKAKDSYGTKSSVSNIYRPEGWRSVHKRSTAPMKSIQPRRMGERTTYRIQRKAYRPRSTAKKSLRSDRVREYRAKRPVRQFTPQDLRSRSSRARTHSLRGSSFFSKSSRSSAIKRPTGKRQSRTFTRSKSTWRYNSRSSFTRRSSVGRSSHSKGTARSTRRARRR